MQNVLIGILVFIAGHQKFWSLVQYYAIQRVYMLFHLMLLVFILSFFSLHARANLSK